MPHIAETTGYELRFAQAIDALAMDLPQVIAQREAIERGGQALIEAFAVDPDFFDSKVHTLFFASLGQRYANLEDGRDELTTDAYVKEKEFIGCATAMLVLDKSGDYKSFKSLLDSDELVDAATKENVFNHFTNRQVTEELRRAIGEGLLDEVKARMGITSENEDPYEVRVLNIGQNLALQGMSPTRPKGSGDSNEAHYEEIAADYEKYEAGLEANTEAFRKSIGLHSEVPPAWVTTVGGKRTLCVPLPVIEKILYRDQLPAAEYSESDRQRDIGVLEHEYVHTQGGLNLDHEIYYGIALEERRAEFFAGDRTGYDDIKAFFMDLAGVTALNIYKAFPKHPKGGDIENFYVAIAQDLDLQATLQLALVAPESYIKDGGDLQQTVNSYLGGTDALVKRLYEQLTADPIKEQRVAEQLG
jgi:hypothetical protein